MMEQLSLMDELFPQPKIPNCYLDFVQWLKDGKDFENQFMHQDALMFFNSCMPKIDFFYKKLGKEKKDMMDIMNSKCYHHFQDNNNTIKSIYSFTRRFRYSDTPKGKFETEYIRVFRVGDRQLLQTHGAKDRFEEVYFPASTIAMLDSKGKEIHFNNRDDFIMKDLGFEHHGIVREKIFGNMRNFATLKSTINNIINYWKETT
jgi:hypothetical protein